MLLGILRARSQSLLAFPSRFNPLLLQKLFLSGEAAAGAAVEAEEDIERSVTAVFHILTTSSSNEEMAQSLKASEIFLSNDLIDGVLKRVRFSHGNPFRVLGFFQLTGRRQGFFHPAFSYDAMLYSLGRSRRFEGVWKLLIKFVGKMEA